MPPGAWWLLATLLASTRADVSHVLRGESRPPTAREVNSLSADAGDYWWMADDSPFKQAYEVYRKCTEKGDCVKGSGKAHGFITEGGAGGNSNFPPIDVKKNPFFNGGIQGGSFTSGPGGAAGQEIQAFHSGGKIDVSKNPFLNGEFVAGNGAKVKDENGFIGVQPKKPGFATSHPLESNKPGFSTNHPIQQQTISRPGGQESIPFGGIGFGAAGAGSSSSLALGGSRNQNGLQSSGSGPTQPPFGGVACSKKNHACVPKQQCVNGAFSGNTEKLLLGLYCNPQTEECCRLPGQGNSNVEEVLPKLSGKTAHPTSINDLISSNDKYESGATFKLAGGNGSSPITIQVLGGNDAESRSQQGTNVAFSTLKPIRDVNANDNSVYNSPVDYSNVHFDSNVRFASTIQGPEYLPPLEGTTPSISTYQPPIPTTPRPISCPPGTVRKADGVCESPACPYGYEQQPDGSCRKLQPPSTAVPVICPTGTYLTPSGKCSTPSSPIAGCPFGTQRQSDGSCGRIQPSTTPAPITCPPGTYLTPSGRCSTPSTPQPCPPGTIRKPNGICEREQCPFGTQRQPDGSCSRIQSSTTPAPITCPPGSYLTPSGRCSSPSTPHPCPPGTTRKPNGICEREECPFGTQRQPDGTCGRVQPSTTVAPITCPPGTYLTPNGRCSTPSTPQPCPPGTIRKPNGICEREQCPFGTQRQPDGSCSRIQPPTTPAPITCPPGTYLTPSGRCSTPSTPQPCSPGTIRKPNGICEREECPFGTQRQPDGSCGRVQSPTIPTPVTCPPGTYLTPSGRCSGPSPPTASCSPGQIRRPDGSCYQPSSPVTTPTSCPPNTYIGPSGSCEPVGVASTTPGYVYPKPCPPGTIKTPSGGCEEPTPACPSGTRSTPYGTCEPIIPASTPKPFERPRPTPSVPDIKKDYLPPITPTQPTAGYHYETPTPAFGYPSSTTLISSQNNINSQYANIPSTARPQRPGEVVPESPDNSVESANANSYFVSTTRRPPVTGRPPFEGGRQPSPIPAEQEPPVGCAAALKCVQEIYCTADGFVSPVPVVLTKEQETLRVPTTTCKDLETGIIGKCCRDPNYKDPWPSANLVNGVDDGQYKEDNFYGQRELLNSNRLTRSSNGTSSVGSIRNNKPNVPIKSESQCGVRNLDSSPKGESPLDANFAEYPWQAMILRESNRSLLCGGVIIRDNAILTAAHCVEGLDTNDVLAKGGEWKLGIDEEPLPFQIVKVGAIIRHPEYKPGSYHHDMAILVLREKLRFTKNVGPLCLSQTEQTSTDKCKLTGWGKRILQLHAKGALMHHIDVNLVDNNQCQQKLSQQFQESLPNYGPNTICGQSNIDHCKVDYGSALACENDQGQYTFVGIYAWDTGCNTEGQIAGYVKPDKNWIEGMLRLPIKELKKIEREYLLNTK